MKASSIAILLLSALPLLAESRTWTKADASASFEGEYISHTSQKVSIRRADGKEFTVDMGALHADDLAWIKSRDKPTKTLPEPPAHAAFDTLCFGDDRETVQSKLLASDTVEPIVEAKFLGRLGLNGSFRTRKKVGELSCLLYFGWSADGGLKEITLQTESCEAAAYPETIKSTWIELDQLMTDLHGKPLQAAAYPKATDLPDGGFLGTHLWRLADGGSAMLGTAREGSKFQTAVKFTSERLEPVRVP